MLSPPPPLPGSEVRGRLQHSAYFQQRMSQGGFAPDDVTLVPDAVRCRLWRLMVEAYRSFAEDHEVDFLASPAEAQDSAGNLRSEFWHPRDGTHANGKYGQEYLRQIRAWAGGTR